VKQGRFKEGVEKAEGGAGLSPDTPFFLFLPSDRRSSGGPPSTQQVPRKWQFV